MSTVYTPSAVVLGNITIPADGDARTAASVNAPLEALADGLTYEAARTTPLADLTALAAITAPADGTVRHVLGFGYFVFKTSATTGISPFRVAAADATTGGWKSSAAHETSKVIRCSPGNMAPHLSSSAAGGILAQTPSLTAASFSALTSLDVALFKGSLQFNTVVTGSATALGVSIGLDPYLVDGATLSQIRLNMASANAHGALPALMPKFGVLRTAFDQSTATLLSTGSGLAADASASTAAYQAQHWNTFTPDQNNVIDRTLYSYSLQIWNEGSTNALIQLATFCVEITLASIPDARRQ